jgi:hypothetical protein
LLSSYDLTTRAIFQNTGTRDLGLRHYVRRDIKRAKRPVPGPTEKEFQLTAGAPASVTSSGRRPAHFLIEFFAGSVIADNDDPSDFFRLTPQAAGGLELEP